MDALLSTNVTIPMSQIITVLAVVSIILIARYIKLSFLISYGTILYWSHIWKMSVSNESVEWKLDSPAVLILTGCMIILALLTVLCLALHKE